MTNKLHTSQKTQEIFNSLGQSLRLQPFILSKLAIALSVRKGQLQANDFKTDNNGLELSRQVIFGDHDLLFKSLIINNEGKVIREDDYFPGLVKAHLIEEQSFEDENGTAKISIIICAIWMTTSKGGLYGLSKGQSLFRYLRR